MTKMEVFNLADEWVTMFKEDNNKVGKVIADFNDHCTAKPTDKLYFQKALDAFWSKLKMARIWVGTTEKKCAGWNYIEPSDIFRVLEGADLIVITEMGANTGKKSMRIDSVYGLVKTIRSVNKGVKIYVKVKLEKELWKDVLAVIHNKEEA